MRAWLVALSLAAGALFFVALPQLWPLTDTPLDLPPEARHASARDLLEGLGHDLDGFAAASALRSDEPALRYIERAFGRDEAQRLIREGLPIIGYRVQFKQRGNPTTYVVRLQDAGRIHAWSVHVEPDEPGAQLDAFAALSLAEDALQRRFEIDLARYELRSEAAIERPARRDHTFSFRRVHVAEPELRERVTVTVAGDRVTFARRQLIVPAEAERAERASEAPSYGLQSVGFLLVAVAVLGAFVIALDGLRKGRVHLRRVIFWPAVVLVGQIVVHLLDRAMLFNAWDPLWPRWLSDFDATVFAALQTAYLLLVLVGVVAAGESLDTELPRRRGESLWLLARGKLTHPLVTAASGRGFLVGMLCGGTMVVALNLVLAVAGGSTGLQPRDFFFYTLNSASPAISSIAFFIGVALGEELGYRYFAGNWLLKRTGRAWIAIAIPAIIYGITHTRLDFLPPEQPWWGRAVVLTCVGAVWGWAYLRFDALTVVLSHLTADLFIFNWPLIASDRLEVRATALATVCVPLIPAVLGLIRRRR